MEIKRKVLESAYIPILPQHVPVWENDGISVKLASGVVQMKILWKDFLLESFAL